MDFKHILVPTDFSEYAAEAFDVAAYQAKMQGSKITLVNVSDLFDIPPELRRVIWHPENINKMQQEYEAAARDELKRCADENFHGLPVHCVSIMSNRSAGWEICKYAREHDVDVIIISGHGRGRVSSFLLGSVVQKILHDAPCPVLVVKGQHAAEI